MFKRAYLYACTAPVPDAPDADEYEQLTEIAGQEQAKRLIKHAKGKQSGTTSKQDAKESPQSENDLIQWMPGGKVAKCKLCANKTMLNQDAVQKHLDSKAHKTLVKRATARRQQANELRTRFLQRMDSAEKKAAEAIRQQ